MKFSNAQIRTSLEAIAVVRTDGVNDEGVPQPRVFPNTLRKLDYALFQTAKGLQSQWKALSERAATKRKDALEVIKVTKKDVLDGDGNPIVEEVERFPTIKAKRDFTEWENGEMDEVVEVEIHRVTAKHILEAYNGEDKDGLLPDGMFPALFELDYLFEE